MKIQFEDGSYVGAVDDSYVPDGAGVWSSARNKRESFRGFWVHGKRQGPGIHTFANGRQWEGSWTNNAPVGPGRLLAASATNVLAEVDFAAARTWRLSTLTEACTVLAGGAGGDDARDAASMVKREESRLFRVPDTLGEFSACARFLTTSGRTATSGDSPASAMLRSNVEARVAGLMRLYCTPPNFRLADAAALAAAAGDFGEAWRPVIDAVASGRRDLSPESLQPRRLMGAERHDLQGAEWLVYGKRLTELRMALDAVRGQVSLGSGMDERRFLELWAGWRHMRARFTVADKGDGTAPAWPKLTWEQKPAATETVTIADKCFTGRESAILCTGVPWGSTLAYKSKLGSAEFDGTLVLVPKGYDLRTDTLALATGLMGLKGMALPDARKQVRTWQEYLSPTLRLAGEQALRINSTVTQTAGGVGSRWPRVDIGLAAGERVEAQGGGQSLPAGVCELPNVRWGSELAYRVYNRAGVYEDRTLQLSPPGGRVAELLGLAGCRTDKALESVEAWRPYLGIELLREASQAAIVSGVLVLEPIADELDWPCVSLRNTGGIRWRIGKGRDHLVTGRCRLDGARWGETVTYVVSNRWGVWEEKTLLLDAGNITRFWVAGQVDWARLPEQWKSINIRITDELKQQVGSHLVSEAWRALPEAFTNAAHALSGAGVTEVFGQLGLDAAVTLLRDVRDLYALDVGLVADREVATFVLDPKSGNYTRVVSSTAFRDRLPGTGQKLRSITSRIAGGFRDLPASVQPEVRKVIRQKVLQRAGALKPCVGAGKDQDMTLIREFLAFYDNDLMSGGLLEGLPADDPLARAVAELRDPSAKK